MNAAKINTRLSNVDSARWSLHRVIALHGASTGVCRSALRRYARSASWALNNADLTSNEERRASYFALHAAGEIVRIYK